MIEKTNNIVSKKNNCINTNLNKMKNVLLTNSYLNQLIVILRTPTIESFKNFKDKTKLIIQKTPEKEIINNMFINSKCFFAKLTAKKINKYETRKTEQELIKFI